ncbi:MAG: glycosyltransferase [Erysipelotrichaceae bacterium]|nr:glycosyltransferase [Erysipelotrichaceae bacterium]
MKVALINSVYGFGSTGKIVMNLCKMDNVLAKAFYGRKAAVNDGIGVKFNGFWGNVNQTIQTFILDNHGFSCTYATKKLVDKLKEFDPDIVHLHNLHGYYIHVGILFEYLKNANIKVIWTLHDCWSFTGHCPHFEAVGCNRWIDGCYECPLYLKYPFSFNKYNAKKNYQLKKAAFSSVSNMHIVVPSNWLKDQVQKSYLNKYPCEVINNGIDLNIFKYEKTATKKAKFTILAVSSMWYTEKGLKDLVAFAKLLDDDMELVVIGLNKKQSKMFGKNVCCLQRTNNVQELVDHYNAADVFVNFTYEDTFPTVNLEAMACGLPVFTYRSGGATEMIDECSGRIITKYAVNEMYQRVIQLKNKEISFDKQQIAARMDKYDLKKMYERYFALYERIYHGKD